MLQKQYVFEHIFTRKHVQIENDAAVNAKYNTYAFTKATIIASLIHSQYMYIMQKAIFENINLTEYYTEGMKDTSLHLV